MTYSTKLLWEESQRRKTLETPNARWIERFGGRPREFIGEIIGFEWYEDGWIGWRSFVATVFAEPLDADELEVYQHCTGRISPPAEPSLEVWEPVGRRGGKSRVLALIAVYLAVCVDWTPHLSPGERGHIVVLAAQRKQAAAIMDYVKAILNDPRLRPLVNRDLSESIDLAGSVRIEVVTASISAVRSRTVIAALCDEIAFWESEEASANPDAEILNALRPAMATIPRAMLLAASSPYARRGALWEAFSDHYGKDDGPLVWRADTRTMHPSVTQAFIDEEYRKDPISAAAEYGAEFRADVAAFISREALDRVIVEGRFELAPIYGTQYHAFVDPSGGMVDSFTLAISHREADGKVVLDLLRESRPPLSPEMVIEDFVAILKYYRVGSVRGDRYGGEFPREQFRKRGIQYEESELSASDIYREFLPIINTGRAELLDHHRMYYQILGLDRRISRTGRDSISHPASDHDDVANVAAGALVMAAGQQAVVFSSEVVRQLAAGGTRFNAAHVQRLQGNA